MPPVLKIAGSSPATHVLPRFILTIHDDIYSFTAKHSNVYCHWNFRTFGRMNFLSWVYLYCLSISTKDKVHFLWIFPIGKFRFCYDSFQKSTRKYTGGVTQITLGYLSFFSSPARLIGFSREFSNFSSPHATGDMHRNFQPEIWERPSLYRFI